MRVQKLELRNFRNLSQIAFEADPKINLILGKNGQGKTSILEGIGYLASLRSFRSAKVTDLVQQEFHQSTLRCVLQLETESQESDWTTQLEIELKNKPSSHRIAKVNGKIAKSTSSYLTQRFGNARLGFHAVIFNPADHDLIQGDPKGRRAYLDQWLSAENPNYLESLTRYKRVLDQRNALLKNEHGFSHSYLEEFDRPLIQTGANLTQERLRWIHRINLPLKEAVKRIAKNQADISLNYRSNWAFSDSFPGLIEPISLEILETNFRKNLLQQRAVEQRLKSTIVGPHRDDWEISLGAAPLKSFGSQGEIRSVLLGMKICEIESFQTTTQQLPVFLLDDLSSELDQWRRKQLIEFLEQSNLQVFITTTESSWTPGKVIQILDGAIHDDSRISSQ